MWSTSPRSCEKTKDQEKKSIIGMRAWFYHKYGGPSVLQFGEQPEPQLLDPRDVIIKVHAAALNPIDYKRRQGALKYMITHKWPATIGYDVSGIIVTCGAHVTKFKAGDAVFCMLPHDRNGGVAEFVSVHEDYIALKPKNLSHVEAASLPLVTLTALKCFRTGEVNEGANILITGGAGGVGTIAIQMAKNVFKAKKIAATCSSHKMTKVQELGADEVIDYTSQKFELSLSGYEFALDCTGESRKCMDVVGHAGTVISIAETPNQNVFTGMESKGLKVSCLLGFVLDCLSRSVIKKANQLGINYRFLFTSGDGKYLNEIREFCEKKQIVPVVDKIYSFEEANIALEYLESGQATGKVVVQIVS